MAHRSLIAFLALAASINFALAGDVLGEWSRDDGKARVRFAPCGAAVCGAITWLKDTSGAGKVGQRVFFDMKPKGDDAWAGSAFNPEDGREYTGKMTLAGDHLSTAGCVFGGLICKTVEWTRSH
ncbi:DUF2147 domain-containing protein [Methylocapsa sp. S129]|uniref:DUF2147 domain-containing protein n=1 Tax=Methylocapsa sp. S129 TaxID=1641869 RepID=UPI00131C969E|nr:DUF2147 domain-containing protein [Methylocapsa sp. S129]